MKLQTFALVALLALAGCTDKDRGTLDVLQTAVTGDKTLDPVALDAAPLSVAPAPAPVVAAAPACVPAFRMPCPGDDE